MLEQIPFKIWNNKKLKLGFIKVLNESYIILNNGKKMANQNNSIKK